MNVELLVEETMIAVLDATDGKPPSQWKSLQHLGLVLALEEVFQLHFTAAEISRMNSSKAICEIIKTLLERGP